MKSGSYAKGQGNSCTITVDASPGAIRTEIVGVNPWRKALQIRIAARAKDGEANAELLKFLSERLSVSTASIELIRGEKSSLKVLRLPLSAENARRLLGGDWTLSAEERLEQLEKTLDELEDVSELEPIIVEGARDVAALKRLGITKNVYPLNKGKSVFRFCEEIAGRSDSAVILTDWDRRGGHLARMLKEGLEANGVRVNDRIRAQIVILSKKEIKYIESMPTFIARLKAAPRGIVDIKKSALRGSEMNRVRGKRI